MYIHIIAFIGIVGLNIIILGLVIYWYRNKMLSQYNSFLNKADEILGGKQIDMRYDESLDSAISERLNRIVEISNMQKHVAWYNELKSHDFNEDTVDQLLKEELTHKFVNVLEDAGVFKMNEEGKEAFIKFVEMVGEK